MVKELYGWCIWKKDLLSNFFNNGHLCCYPMIETISVCSFIGDLGSRVMIHQYSVFLLFTVQQGCGLR